MKDTKTIIEYEKPQEKQSNTLAAVATALGGGALLGVVGNAVGNTFSRYAGQIANNIGGGSIPVNISAAVAPIAADTVTAINGRGFVTKEESKLIRENSEKDSEIALLKAKIYADNAVKESEDKLRHEMKSEVEALKTRVCELEKEVAVNAESDRNYRHYAECAFVHQPKAYMRNRIVTCKPDKCHDRHNCNHDWQ